MERGCKAKGNIKKEEHVQKFLNIYVFNIHFYVCMCTYIYTYIHTNFTVSHTNTRTHTLIYNIIFICLRTFEMNLSVWQMRAFVEINRYHHLVLFSFSCFHKYLTSYNYSRLYSTRSLALSTPTQNRPPKRGWLDGWLAEWLVDSCH